MKCIYWIKFISARLEHKISFRSRREIFLLRKYISVIIYSDYMQSMMLDAILEEYFVGHQALHRKFLQQQFQLIQ